MKEKQMSAKLVEPLSYVIVITWDNCDPDVYGFFQTEEEAEKDAEYIKSKWKEWEWGHSPCVSIEKLLEVKK
tara:strand:+ start:208 stop:423 length:216 start_codon:yes stop_codon:yes gene_type:complete